MSWEIPRCNGGDCCKFFGRVRKADNQDPFDWETHYLEFEEPDERLVSAQQMKGKLYIFTEKNVYIARKIRWYHRAWDKLKGWFGI